MTRETPIAPRRGSRRQGNAPTIADVAKLAQCSSMTVSRVVNGDGNVREKTREKVRAAVEQLNYFPNRAARTLAGADQIRIGLLYANPSAAYLSEFLVGGLEEAGRSDVQLVVEKCQVGSNERKVVQHMIDVGIDGVICPSPLCDNQNLIQFLNNSNMLAVAVGPGKPSPLQSAISIDEYRAAHDMTRHIIAQGHSRVGFIIGNPEQSASERRLSGYVDALAEAKLPVIDELIVQGYFTYRSGLNAAARLLDLDERPTAIFASNDDMAAATVAVAHRRHLDVPGDLTVCGFDDTALASTVWPELTTVHQPIADMSRAAVELLVKKIRARRSGEPDVITHLQSDYTLIQRDSDAAPSLARRPSKK